MYVAVLLVHDACPLPLPLVLPVPCPCRGGIEGFRIAGKQGIGIIALCQLFLMGGPEYARYATI